MDLSKQKFYEFVDSFAEITGASAGTAGNVRSICHLVGEYIPDNSPAEHWDASGIVNAYVMANGIAEETQKSYISRFSGAVAKFIAYAKGQDVTVKQRRSPVKSVQHFRPSPQQTATKTFELPIPLREDLIVMISNLPRNLTKEEAKRISTIIESFAITQPTDDLI